MCKKALCLIFAFLLSIESFGAVVSDNDGSAFVTKAEFEALKNNFAAQIDNYNTSIDSKIDGSIASYLAGIKLSKAPENYFIRIKKALGEVRFKNSVKSTSNVIATNEILNVYRHWRQARYTGLELVFKMWPSIRGNGLYYSYNVALIKAGTSSAYNDMDGSTFLLKAATGIWEGDPHPNGVWIVGPSGNFQTNGSQTGLGTKKVGGTEVKQIVTNGSGQVYTYKITPIGRKVLTRYNISYYPVCNINVFGHSYINYAQNFWTNYKGTNLQRDVISLTRNIGDDELLNWGSIGSGTQFAQTYEGATETRWNAQVYTVSTSDNYNYELAIWGKVPTNNIYCVNQNSILVAGTRKTINASESQGTIKAENWDKVSGLEEKDVTLSGVTTTYTPPKLNTELKSIDSFANDYISTIVGETIYHGQGIKIGEVTQDEDINVRITFKNELSSNQTIKFILTSGKIGAANTKVLSPEETITINGNDDSIIIRKVSLESKSDIWFNCYNTTDGVDALVDDIQLSVAN